MREKVGKSRNTVFFQWFGAPEGRKVGGCGASWPDERWKNCTPLWREAHLQVKMYKTPGARSTFGSWDVEKVYAVVARSTCPSQNVQNTSASEHFWKLRCRKSACRCGAKHISKSKCTKHSVGPLLEVEMSKKCTPLWREAHFQVKMYKTPQRRTTFGGSDVEKVHAVVARSTFPSQNVQNTRGSDHVWRFRCGKSARRCGTKHIWKSKCTKHLSVGPLLEVQMSLRFVPLHYTTLHYTTLHSTTLHWTTLHYTTLHNITTTTTQLHSTTLNYTTLHYTTFHYTTLHYTTLHYPSTTLHYTPLHYNYNYNYVHSTTFHYTPLHYITLHYITLHYTTTTTTTTQLHSTTLHYTKLHYTTLHCTTLHYTTLHYTTLPSTTPRYRPLHFTTLHYTTLHYTTFHYTPLHYIITLHYITLNDTAPQIDR